MYAPLIISKVDDIHKLQIQRDKKSDEFKRIQCIYKRLIENEYSIHVEVNYKRNNTKQERSDQVYFDIIPSQNCLGDNLKKALIADVQERLKKLGKEVYDLQDEINSICMELEYNTPWGVGGE